MLRHRLIFGPAMVAALLGLIALDSLLERAAWPDPVSGWGLPPLASLPPGLVFLGLIAALSVLTARELARLLRAGGVTISWTLMAAAGVTGCGTVYLSPLLGGQAAAVQVTALTVIFGAALLWYARLRTPRGAAAVGGAAAFGMIYLGVMPGMLLAIRWGYSPWVVAGVVLITKSCDIGAYFTGHLIGRHKLIPWLSPGKTWEGLVGGVVTAAAAAAALALAAQATGIMGRYSGYGPERVFEPGVMPWAYAAAMGLVLGVLGQGGDLLASLLKRDAGVKDSGGSVPGFGGLLDVVDSPIIVAPAAYWLLWAAPLAPAAG